MNRLLALFTGPVLWMATIPSLPAQTAGAPAVQVVVTAEGRHGKEVPSIGQSDVAVNSGKESLDVLDWVPAQGEHGALQLLVLLDDSSDSSLGTELPDLKKFITALPATTQVGLGYIRNGSVLYAQEFTNDHALAASKIRLPMGMAGVNASPYFALTDLAKKWPVGSVRREVLMISDGVDRYGGIGPDNPYVNEAMQRAQRAGLVISSIYWTGVGHFGHSPYRLNWGQNYLAQIADGTGGESYWQGFGNPVSLAPYLDGEPPGAPISVDHPAQGPQ